MPMETAIRRPCNKASYSAALLESVYSIWSTYCTVSPVGDARTMPAPRPARILEPSKCMIQLEYAPYSLGSSASIHSVTKSANTCDLMAHRGLYVMSNGRSSMAHLPIRPVASRFVYYIIERHFRGYCNRTLLKVVSQLPRCHEYRVGYLMITWVP